MPQEAQNSSIYLCQRLEFSESFERTSDNPTFTKCKLLNILSLQPLARIVSSSLSWWVVSLISSRACPGLSRLLGYWGPGADKCPGVMGPAGARILSHLRWWSQKSHHLLKLCTLAVVIQVYQVYPSIMSESKFQVPTRSRTLKFVSNVSNSPI